jgi:hypothetical protein
MSNLDGAVFTTRTLRNGEPTGDESRLEMYHEILSGLAESYSTDDVLHREQQRGDPLGPRGNKVSLGSFM